MKSILFEGVKIAVGDDVILHAYDRDNKSVLIEGEVRAIDPGHNCNVVRIKTPTVNYSYILPKDTHATH